jgi:uncharacterized membrane protein YccC
VPEPLHTDLLESLVTASEATARDAAETRRVVESLAKDVAGMRGEHQAHAMREEPALSAHERWVNSLQDGQNKALVDAANAKALADAQANETRTKVYALVGVVVTAIGSALATYFGVAGGTTP